MATVTMVLISDYCNLKDLAHACLTELKQYPYTCYTKQYLKKLETNVHDVNVHNVCAMVFNLLPNFCEMYNNYTA